MSRDVMKLALEALETERPYLGPMPTKTSKAITALREALAEQPYPENFIDALKYDAAKRDFWEGYVPEPDKRQQALDKKADNARELGLDYEPARDSGIVTAGGADPRTQRTWVGLTDEEIEAEFGFIDELLRDCCYRTAAKLKEKNT